MDPVFRLWGLSADEHQHRRGADVTPPPAVAAQPKSSRPPEPVVAIAAPDAYPQKAATIPIGIAEKHATRAKPPTQPPDKASALNGQASAELLTVPKSAPAPTTAEGSASYYVPNKMVEKAPAVVHLWIDPEMPVKELQEKLAKQLNLDLNLIKIRMANIAPGTANTAGDIQGLTKVRVGDRMVAELIGNDFEISPKETTPGELDGKTWKWQWQVTPQRASNSKPLLLTIKAWIDETPRKTSMPSINEPVIVEADEPTVGRVKRVTEWLKALEDLYKALAGLVLILVPLAITFRKKIRQLISSKDKQG